MARRKRTKNGEKYTDLYITSFRATFYRTDNNQPAKLRARVLSPPSEIMFYSTLNTMVKGKAIQELTRLSAERQMYYEGYRVVA